MATTRGCPAASARCGTRGGAGRARSARAWALPDGEDGVAVDVDGDGALLVDVGGGGADAGGGGAGRGDSVSHPGGGRAGAARDRGRQHQHEDRRVRRRAPARVVAAHQPARADRRRVRALHRDAAAHARASRPQHIKGVAISNVVPPVQQHARVDERDSTSASPPFTVEPGVNIDVRARRRQPDARSGPTAWCNVVAARGASTGPRSSCVDFGTATTFDCVNARGEFVGGAIAPGLMHVRGCPVSTARLASPGWSWCGPRTRSGATPPPISSPGVIYGYAGLVDGLVERMQPRARGDARGWSPRAASPRSWRGRARASKEVDEHLSLEGLRMLWERANRTCVAGVSRVDTWTGRRRILAPNLVGRQRGGSYIRDSWRMARGRRRIRRWACGSGGGARRRAAYGFDDIALVPGRAHHQSQRGRHLLGALRAALRHADHRRRHGRRGGPRWPSRWAGSAGSRS